MQIHIRLLFIPILLLLSQCSPSTADSNGLPTLTNPARAKAWGSPKVTRTSNGYKLAYSNPSNSKERMMIEGSRKALYHILYPPNLVGAQTINGVSTKVDKPQTWQKSLVLNQTLKWYQRTLPSKEYGAIFRSMGAELKTADGSKGHYLVEVEGTKNQMQRWLSELRFAR